MTDEEFHKQWGHFLVEIARSETELAKELGTSQQNLNKKIRNATLRYVEFANILEKYGYQLKIEKKE